MNIIEFYQKVQKFRVTSDPKNYREYYPNGPRVPFGQRRLIQHGIHVDAYCDGDHPAWDLSKEHNAPIQAFGPGIVVAGTGWGPFGWQTVVAYAYLNVQVIYGHLNGRPPVKIGDLVERGTIIGRQGNSNNDVNPNMPSHLHLQVQELGYIASRKKFTCTGIDATKFNVDKKPEPKKDPNYAPMIIDVSHHQDPGNINYDVLSQHVDHVIIRTMDADMIDRAYKTHHAEFRKRGIPTAAYAFFRARNNTHVVNEAKMFWDRTKDLDPTFWWIDIETVSHKNMRAAVNLYVSELRKHGAKKVGLYIAHHLYKQLNLDTSKADAVWIPHYGSGSAEPDSKPQFPADIHQYTEHGRLEGYNGNLDLNRIISDKSLSYFTDGKVAKRQDIITAPAPKKTVEQLADEVLAGLHGDGDDRKASLGDQYNAVQKIVNAELTKSQKYTVKKGDNLSSIAARFNTTTSALQTLNNLGNPDLIYPGQVLTITGTSTPVTYTVQIGDNLSSIAKRHGTTTAALQNLNNIPNANLIYPGDKIKISGGKSAPKKKKAAPKKQYHSVKAGDTVSGLAQRYGSSQSNIVKWNNLRNANEIYVGDRLRVK